MASETLSPEAAQEAIAIAAVSAAIDRLRNTIAMARALVLSGREVELAGLDAEAERLCAAVVCLPDEAGRHLLDPMMGLTREVDLLAICIPPP